MSTKEIVETVMMAYWEVPSGWRPVDYISVWTDITLYTKLPPFHSQSPAQNENEDNSFAISQMLPPIASDSTHIKLHHHHLRRFYTTNQEENRV